MEKDLSKQLQVLREVHDLLEKKEPVPEDLVAQIAPKGKLRLKDIQKEIARVKKLVSTQTKQDIAKEEQRELEALAKERNMTVEEFKEYLDSEKNQKSAFAGDHAAKQRAQERALAEARAKKGLTREVDMGEHDMFVEYI